MNKYSRLGKNSLLILIGSIGSKLIAILMLPFYTTWLSVEKYGDVDLVSTYASLMLGIVSLCMTDAIFRFPQGKSVDEQKKHFIVCNKCLGARNLGCYILLFWLYCIVYGMHFHSVVYTAVLS